VDELEGTTRREALRAILLHGHPELAGEDTGELDELPPSSTRRSPNVTRLIANAVADWVCPAFVVDDLATEPTWAPRGVSVRGAAQIHPEGGERLAPGFGPIWVEIIPESISVRGIDTSAYEPPNSRKVVTP
jgi:hypothetical protein